MSRLATHVMSVPRRTRRAQAASMKGGRLRERSQADTLDTRLLGAMVILLCLGLVMVASASITIADRQYGQPFYYLQRQAGYVSLGLIAGAVVLFTKLQQWERYGGWLFMLGILLLVLVLVPGIGREVNGSMRWIAIGGVRFQPSELMKLAVVLYVAGYLVRRERDVHGTAWGFLKPVSLLTAIAALLLLEPDFGAAVIIFATALGMMFLGGLRLWQFGLLVVAVVLTLSLLALSSPYRLDRLTTFLDPWGDPFNRGFQLTQALIAFGYGEWFGVGLGGSIQKLFYLPEAHTDFLFAVLAEELGLAGAVGVVVLFIFIVWRAFMIGHQSELAGKRFAAFIAYGLGLWIGLQAIINIGVNTGLLPTKGLTLPLMSYGGSSIMVMCIAIALLLRIDIENRMLNRGLVP